MNGQLDAIFAPAKDAPTLPSRFQLRSGELAIWDVSLTADPGVRDACEAFLSVDERDRAARFVYERERRRFTLSHAALRIILGGYSGHSPYAVSFVTGPQGKPALGGASKRHPAFNMAHAGERAIIAVAAEGNVGVDIEPLRRIDDAAEIANSYFSAAEIASLRHYGTDSASFLTCWTRKEAFIKAVGGGLSIALDSFDVALPPATPSVLRCDHDSGPPERWTMLQLEPIPGYVGAVVIDRPLRIVTTRRFLLDGEVARSHR